MKRVGGFKFVIVIEVSFKGPGSQRNLVAKLVRFAQLESQAQIIGVVFPESDDTGKIDFDIGFFKSEVSIATLAIT